MIDTTKRISKVTYNGRNIPVGPAQAKVEEKDVNFIDFDGTLLHSYTKEQAMALSALPDPPDHSDNEVPLTFDGWNWDLDEIKGQLTEVGGVVWVGATYYTNDGYTHIIVEVDDDDTWGIKMSGNCTIDWGDGTVETISGEITHVYSNGGTYDIKANNGTISMFGKVAGSGAYYAKYRRIYLSKDYYNNGFSQHSFYNCWCLEAVTFPNNMRSYGDFEYCHSLRSITIPKGISTINSSSFKECFSLKNVSIPSSINTILSQAFSDCHSFESITLPKNLNTMQDYVFSNCRSFKSITWNNLIVTISNGILQHCYALNKISFKEGTASIGSSAFYNCKSLQSITMPQSVTNIGSSAFANCYCTIKMEPTTPPTIATNTLNGNIPKIIVPKGCLEAYQNATNWSSYASKMVEADE